MVEQRSEPFLLLNLAAWRTRSSACDTRPGTASGSCFAGSRSLGPRPCSTGSAAVLLPALFVGFPATLARSDFLGSFIIGFGSSPSRCGPVVLSAKPKISRSHTKSVRTCQGLRPRRTGDARVVASARIAFHVKDVSAFEQESFSRSMAGCAYPCQRFAAALTDDCDDSGPLCSLLLQCSGLSPPTPRRFRRRTLIGSRSRRADSRPFRRSTAGSASGW